LNSLRFLISYPIPRKIWPNKPQPLGITVVRASHIPGTNWGVGFAGQAVYEQARRRTRAYNVDLAECLDDREAACLDLLLNKLTERATELTRREIAAGGTDDPID